jgi:plastocyanin
MAATLLTLVLVAAACSGDDGEGGGEGAGAAGGPVTIDISLSDFAITPDRVEAPSGQDLAFNVSNDGQTPHSFAVDTGSGVLKTADLNAGETATLEVPALADGEYKISCAVPGHEDLGMVGSLMVSADAVVAEGSSGVSSATGATGAAGHTTMSHEGITVEQMPRHKAGAEAFPRRQGLGGQP